MRSTFEELVELKYQVYNSLFLDLPFEQTYQTGIYLPLMAVACRRGFENGLDPSQIVEQFFADYFPGMEGADRLGLMFRFTQYIERQVVLFDSVEDAAFDRLHDRGGKGSVSQVIESAEASGRLSELRTKLDDFAVRVVLTAHPTQFYPSQVLAIQTDLQKAIRRNNLSEVKELLNQLGKTPFFKKEKPTPYEEAVRLAWYLENVFYDTIATIVENICRKMSIPMVEWENLGLVKVGFWPAGDRDGNPFVTPDITLKVARRLRETALKRYHKDLKRLRRRLTFRNVEDLIYAAETKLYNTIYTIGEDHYQSPQELLEDLFEARKNLLDFHGGLFLHRLDSLILKVRIFGFFMACLDIRQDSRVHRRGWSQWVEAATGSVPDLESKNSIEEILQMNKLPDFENITGDEGKDLLRSLEAIKTIQKENGLEGCHRYIISNCQKASDIALLFKAASLAWTGSLPLDIVPLFESVDDLGAASETMEVLFQSPEYMKHLQERRMIQTIMLGFSDGTKDGGYLQANWSIFKAKEALSQKADEYGVKVVFFDGRGGPPSRGGGNTHNFYAALGDRIHNHEIQLTIQGQTISSNYGQLDSCRHNLEQLLTAGLENAVFPNQTQNLDENQRNLLEELSDLGYKKYVDLKKHERFLEYLQEMTPMKYFGDTNIASRPTSRKGGQLSLADLRAITFVGAWGQMKQNVPGFYGVGTAIKKLSDDGRGEDVGKLYKESLFFRTLLGNSMQSLEKAAFEVTRYIEKDEKFGGFWQNLFREYEDSIRFICEASGQKSLMTENPDIRKSILMREDIVLPVITIQQYALLELRRESSSYERESLEKLIIRTMFGIINAARNAA